MGGRSSGFPIRIKSGSASVSIYNKSRQYPYYRVAYYSGAKRRMVPFQRLSDARLEARKIAERIRAGDVSPRHLSRTDMVIYERATEALMPLGIPLDTAALELVETRKLIGDKPLTDLAQFYLHHSARKVIPKSPREVMAELIEQKRKDGISDRYCEDLKYRLGRVADAFQCEIGTLTPQLIQQFLNQLDLAPRSINNFRKTLKTLFEFAKSRRYMDRDTDPLEGISKQRELSTVEIFMPDEMNALMKAVQSISLVPIALGGFAGLRSAEIERLEWDQVRLGAEPHLIVNADQAKTRSRRLVPIQPNLAAWLAPFVKASGKVWPHRHDYFYESQRVVAHRAGVKWKTNALRHSYISYRMATIRDANQVALEAGNSPTIIFKNYLELVTRTAAKGWFSIEPVANNNVISIPSAG